ncbi:hypothetical protein QAD02_006564 [Eretmocerus hayati]|uniref:Uncharacterized protein n=1 Tax=Eretmocerus hayati TaxID=131215 RepID=A0ACC2N3K3_9HYME|nr:hypothetical protein QAD02_006564 [Eretmocerus hayati]
MSVQVPCRTKSATIDLLTHKKSAYLEKLKDSVPLPDGAIPTFGLPKWKHMPLEAKIPMVAGLRYVLTRRKIGQKLRVDFVDSKRFDTSDPYNRDAPLAYEGLHDPHLQRFFNEAVHVRDAIIKNGLVTEDLDVTCNLREYNAYRSYLRMIHGKYIRKELENRDETLKERLMLELVQKMTEKKNDRLKKDEIRDCLYKELQLKKEQRILEIIKKLSTIDEKAKIVDERMDQIVQRIRCEIKTRQESVDHKRALMEKQYQQKILNTLKKMHEREYKLRKTLEHNFAQKSCAKAAAAVERFEKKKKAQEESIERESALKDCADIFKKAFLEEYDKKISQKRKRQEELLLKRKKALARSRLPKKKPKKKKKCCCRKK